MSPDDLICYCYEVPLRKLTSYAQRIRPRCASQMTGCLGAGTGCGWCIPFLEKIAADPERFIPAEAADDYAARRQRYLTEKHPRNTFTDSAATGKPASDSSTG